MDDDSEHEPFARGRHLAIAIALAGSVAYALVTVWLADGAMLRLLRSFGYEGGWTFQISLITICTKLMVVAFPAWLALTVVDTHAGVRVLPRSWRALVADGVIVSMFVVALLWLISAALVTSPEQWAEGARPRWGWYMTVMTVGVLAEELLFRVLLQRAFEGYMPPLAAVFVQAGLFWLAHAYLYGYGFQLQHGFGGLMFGVIFMRTRSLIAPVAVHMLGNTALVLLIIWGMSQ